MSVWKPSPSSQCIRMCCSALPSIIYNHVRIYSPIGATCIRRPLCTPCKGLAEERSQVSAERTHEAADEVVQQAHADHARAKEAVLSQQLHLLVVARQISRGPHPLPRSTHTPQTLNPSAALQTSDNLARRPSWNFTELKRKSWHSSACAKHKLSACSKAGAAENVPAVPGKPVWQTCEHTNFWRTPKLLIVLERQVLVALVGLHTWVAAGAPREIPSSRSTTGRSTPSARSCAPRCETWPLRNRSARRRCAHSLTCTAVSSAEVHRVRCNIVFHEVFGFAGASSAPRLPVLCISRSSPNNLYCC